MTFKTFTKFTLLIAVALVCSSLAIPSFSAAKKKATSSAVKVPASILTGSDITTGRSFKRSNQKEIYLAGLKLGDNALKVLEKYGNPSRVIIHQAIPEQTTMGGTPGMPGMGGMPGMPSPGMSPGMPGMGGMPGMSSPGMSPGMPGMSSPGMSPGMPGMSSPGMSPGMPGMSSPGMSPGMPGMPSPGMSPGMPGMPSPGMSPGMPGMSSPGMSPGMPGMPGMGGMPGMPGMMGQQALTPSFAGTSTRIDEDSLCWQYELAAGTNLEFVITQNKVSQITVVGLYPWKFAKLNSGLQLGDTYKLANYVWGLDAGNMQIVGDFLRLDYMEKHGTALTFKNKKLVGITIAAGDPIL